MPRRRARAAWRRIDASALGITGDAAAALAAGSAGGTTPYGPVTIERLGRDATAVLVVQFDAPANEEAHGAASAAAKAQPIAAPPAEIVMAAAAATVPQAASGHVRDEGAAERRHPLRFVWQMDADGRFVVGSDEFIELMGPRTTAAFGRLWSEIAAELKLDPENQIPRAVATRETWSGVTVSWPVDDGDERLPVELSGLPVFDRDREFRGYRGFGVCRDLDRINHLARARRERPIGFMTPPRAAAGGRPPRRPLPHQRRPRPKLKPKTAPPAPTVLRSTSCRQRPMWCRFVPAQRPNQRRRR